MMEPSVSTWGAVKAWLLKHAYNAEERRAINGLQRSADEPVAFVQEYGLCSQPAVDVPQGGLTVYCQECGYDLFADGKGVVASYSSRGDFIITVGPRIDLPTQAEHCRASDYLDD